MIHEEICTYEVCKLAKEKGFREKCIVHYYDDTMDWSRSSNPQCFNFGGNTSDASTQSLLQRWLRKEKGYYVYPFYDNNEFKWTYSIREKTGDMWLLLVGETPNFDLFEEAMEAGLKYALKNLVI